jgi:hypothetical protein
MINQRHCPFCKTAAALACPHLALAVEARDFVRACIDSCHARKVWDELCRRHLDQRRLSGQQSPESDDFTWLETAFCDRFLKHLTWFGGMDYEWRSGPRPEQGGFWVLLWSKDPQRLRWELRDYLERDALTPVIPPVTSAPWLIWLNPR